MVEERKCQEFAFKIIDETRNYLIEEMSRNGLISKNHKKVCTVSNYIEHLLILISVVNWCVSVSSFDSLAGIPIGIGNSAVGLKICEITAGSKKYKWINKKKKGEAW